MQAQRARGRLIKEIRESFTVDALIGNATEWERVCIGNLVGLPVIVVPTGFKNISHPPAGGSRRRTTITTGIYAPPNRDHIVCLRLQCVQYHLHFLHYNFLWLCTHSFFSGSGVGNGLPSCHQSPQTAATYQ